MTVAPDNPQPRLEYQRRLESHQRELSRLDKVHRLLGYGKLAVIAAAVILGFFSVLWVPPALIIFVVFVLAHIRIVRERDHATRGAAFYEAGLARLAGNWTGRGETGERFVDPEHPYSADLDLFGKGSLFERLCTARTKAGQQILASWLSEPATPAEIRARTEAVLELRPHLDFREDLAVVGEEVSAGAVPERFAEWAAGRPALESFWTQTAGAVLAVFALVSLIIWAGWSVRLPAIVAVLINGTFWLSTRKRVDEAAEHAEEAARDLRLLSLLLDRLEQEQFSAGLLVNLRSRLDIGGSPPSAQTAKLHRRMEMLESREHLILRMVDPLFFWTLHWSSAVERWRSRSGKQARQWLDVVAQVEAVCSLASYSYEHPSDPFAELVDSGPCYEVEGIAHPLLDESRAVRNNLKLDPEQRLLVVSGSNMSGKSTLLRAVGVNAVLAQCGAPVRATRLVMSPLHIGASIRIMDSLQTGTSRFYAEIKRIRQIMDLTAGEQPVLFLLDELLHGTNSHDRRIGAEAIVRALYHRNAIGLLTTHDLALSAIVDSLGRSARNVHFEDTLENGRLYFDYRLRPDVVSRSNALDLMRSVGLEV